MGDRHFENTTFIKFVDNNFGNTNKKTSKQIEMTLEFIDGHFIL